MPDTHVFHALGLHMHQPPGNLKLLVEHNAWEAEQIIRCYERAVRYAARYPDEATLHVGFSGILLEQFTDPGLVDAYRPYVDLPAMLEAYRETPNVELIGMGYYHPIFPLIPREDWHDQIVSGRQLMEELFGRAPKGFWPPEMAFTMEMVPALVEAGYEYVVVDGVHVQPADGPRDIYRPYLACHEGACITVIPRDRDVSNAQESGLDPGWFANEVRRKVAESPRPGEDRLVTTWSDGENGGWFRQTHEESGFFGHFFSPYMEHVQAGEYPVRPTAISAYLQHHPATEPAHVQTGAWNVGSTSGFDFSQWAGSESQRRAVERVVALSGRTRELGRRAGSLSAPGRQAAAAARALLLEAETSCYLFWGDSWLPQLDARTERVEALLKEAEAAASAPSKDTGVPPSRRAQNPPPAQQATPPATKAAGRPAVARAEDTPATRPPGPETRSVTATTTKPEDPDRGRAAGGPKPRTVKAPKAPKGPGRGRKK